MKGNFDKVIDALLAHEGGFVNHRSDPGGETNMGISKRAYPHENIRDMTKDRAKFLYRRDYWDACRCDDLPGGVDYVVFDAAVNSGTSRAVKWLQQAVGVAIDGKVGIVTLAKTAKMYPPEVIERAIAIRLGFLKNLATWSVFGKGWARRVDQVRKLALSLANHEPVRPDVEPIDVVKSAPKAPYGIVAALAAILAAVAAYFSKG